METGDLELRRECGEYLTTRRRLLRSRQTYVGLEVEGEDLNRHVETRRRKTWKS